MAAPSRTNFGPMTTAFVPPPACMMTYIHDATNLFFEYDCTINAESRTRYPYAASCYPEGLGEYAGTGGPEYSSTMAIYSPASLCPQGYETACVMTKSLDAAAAMPTDGFDSRIVWDALELGEKFIGCCPSGFGCNNRAYNDCLRIYSEETVLEGLMMYGDECRATETTYFVPSATTQNVYALRVNIIESDRAVVSPARPTETSTSTSTADPQLSSGSPEFSSGMTAGIAIAGLISVMSIVGILGCIWQRRRRRRNPKVKMPKEMYEVEPAVTSDMPELYKSNAGPPPQGNYPALPVYPGPPGAYGQGVGAGTAPGGFAEMGSNRDPREIDGRQMVPPPKAFSSAHSYQVHEIDGKANTPELGLSSPRNVRHNV